MSDNATPPVSPHKRERDPEQESAGEPAAKKARVSSSPPRSPSALAPADALVTRNELDAGKREILKLLAERKAQLEDSGDEDNLSLKEQLQARIEEGLEREARLKDHLEAQAREVAHERVGHDTVVAGFKLQLETMRRERDEALARVAVLAARVTVGLAFTQEPAPAATQ
jgi:hypothetical protein